MAETQQQQPASDGSAHTAPPAAPAPADQKPTEQKTGSKTRLREYETLFLIKPELADDAVDKLKERLREIVHREGGKVLKFTNWGKKKTTFTVAKQPRAIYMHIHFLGRPGLVLEVERNLAISEDVTKYMSTRLADEVDPETRAVEPDVKLAGDLDERPRTEGAREGGEGGGFTGGGDRPERGERTERAPVEPEADDVPELE